MSTLEWLNANAEGIGVVFTIVSTFFGGVWWFAKKSTKFDETLSLMTTSLKSMDDKIDVRFNSINQRFDDVDKRFDSVDGRFDDVDDKIEKLNERLTENEKDVAVLDDRIKFQRIGVKK